MELTAWALTFIGVILGVYAIVISVKIFNKQESLQEGLKNIEREKLAYEKNKNKQDLAVEILKSFSAVRESVARIKDSCITIREANEMNDMTSSLHKSKVEIESSKHGILFMHRFEKESEVFNNFFSLKTQIHIFFGGELDLLFKEVDDTIKNIRFKIRRLMQKYDTKIFNEVVEKNRDNNGEMIEDPVIVNFDRMIKQVEDILIPICRN